MPRTHPSTSVPTDEPPTTRLALLAQVLAALSTALLVISTVIVAFASTASAVTATATAPPGSVGLQDLLDWTLYGGSIVCAATAMFGFAKMGISHTQQSYQGANHGKATALLGLVGALGLGLTPTIINGLTAIH
jgi:hypothetical protein